MGGDARAFALGANAFGATATDRAGDVGTASTIVEVKVTHDSPCRPTERFACKPGIARELCARLAAGDASAGRGNADAKGGQISAYVDALEAQSGTQPGKALTVEEGEILIRLARVLQRRTRRRSGGKPFPPGLPRSPDCAPGTIPPR